MPEKNWKTIVGMAVLVLGLAACDQMIENQRRTAWEANALAEGNKAVEACIAARCKTLNIDGLRLEDYSVINALTHVEVLMASRTDLRDLSDISGMSQLRELHITQAEITDLTGLANFPGLEVLHYEHAPADVDITPVAQLSGLKELALGSLGAGADASFIRQMRRLENLVIQWQGVDADLSVLRGHPSLRRVEITGVLPEDQSALLTMPKLRALMVHDAYSLDDTVAETLERRGVLREFPVVVVC